MCHSPKGQIMSTHKHREETKTGTELKDRPLNRRSILLGGSTLAAASALGSAAPISTAEAQAQPAPSGQRPNILVIWGDDVGLANVSAYSFGLMGYKTPNIDRIAREEIGRAHV